MASPADPPHAETGDDAPEQEEQAFVAYAKPLQEWSLKKGAKEQPGHPVYQWAEARVKRLITTLRKAPNSKSVAGNSRLDPDLWPDWVMPVPNAIMAHNGAQLEVPAGKKNVARHQQYNMEVGFFFPLDFFKVDKDALCCIHCKARGVVSASGHNQYLTSVASLGGRRMALLAQRVCHKVCPAKNGKKASWQVLEPDFFKQLPMHVQKDFTNRLHVTTSGGVMRREAVNMLQRAIPTTGNFLDFEEALKELTMLGFEDARLLWMYHMDYLKVLPI